MFAPKYLIPTLFLLGASVASADTSIFRSVEPQKMTVVSQGALSLQKRLDMINNAKHSIEAEFFIYNLDESGRLVTQALIRKAQEPGMRVRLLIDYGLPIAKLNTFFASVLVKSKIEVRYYNPALSFELLKGQFRSHRKSLTVDDQIAVTGGRNIADEYFDLNPKYNFLDRDIFVEGSMAAAIRVSFDQFWNSAMTRPPELKELPIQAEYGLTAPDFGDHQDKARYDQAMRTYETKTAAAIDYITENDTDRKYIQALQHLQDVSGSTLHPRICRNSVFAADMPGIGDKYRVLFEEIKTQVLGAKKRLDIESPYFVMRKDGNGLMEGILANKVEVNLYSNSLNSTDAIYTTATFYPHIAELIQKGMNVFIYKGQSLPNHEYISNPVRDTRWGIHAKSAVVDGKTTLVGTFNADPRSENINAEMAIICKDNTEIAQDVLDSMIETRNASVQLDSSGNPVDGESKYFKVSPIKRLEYHLLTPASNLFDFLL